MAFLDDLGKILMDVGKDAARKAKDVVDILQMKAQINTGKLRLHDLYATIGKSYYEIHRDSTEAEYAEAYGQTRSSLVKIVKLEEKISKLSSTVVYPSCDAVLGEGSAFCNHCGATVVSPSQDLMVVGENAFDETDDVVVEDAKKDVKETAGGIVVEEAEKTGE